MLRTIFLAALAALSVFLIYVAVQPASGTVTRSTTLAATPAAIFPHINDLHKWQVWSPWAKIDPNAKTAFEGPASGVGSVFTWNGNKEIGEGKMTIVDSQPNDHVRIRLEFAKPFSSTSIADLTLKPDGDKTAVTWSMTGERPFMARMMCSIFGVDRMVGGMFEKGLVSLGEAARAP